MLLLSHTHHSSADLTWLTELLSDHSKEQVEPAVIESAGFLALREKECPLAAFSTLHVLPLGLDAFFEEMEVSAHYQPAGGENVVVQAPEIFHRVERVHAAQRLPPGGLFLPPAEVKK